MSKQKETENKNLNLIPCDKNKDTPVTVAQYCIPANGYLFP
jgi:hypothetical protein